MNNLTQALYLYKLYIQAIRKLTVLGEKLIKRLALLTDEELEQYSIETDKISKEYNA